MDDVSAFLQTLEKAAHQKSTEILHARERWKRNDQPTIPTRTPEKNPLANREKWTQRQTLSDLLPKHKES